MLTTRDILKQMGVRDEPGVYVLGCFERRITLYTQQVRALNLIHAFFAEEKLEEGATLAVIGGGAAGLTAAAGAAIRGARVTLFEETSDLLPMFRNNRQRWLHPHLYDWPEEGSDNEHASLPVLGWSADLAGNVAEQLLAQWEPLERRYGIEVHRGVRRIQPGSESSTPRRLTWNTTHFDEGEFDAVILAVGFGTERKLPGAPSRAYWDNDDLDRLLHTPHQPKRYLISGTGDGGLVDLLRVRLRDFRHERIIQRYLQDTSLEDVKRRLLELEESFHKGQLQERGFFRHYKELPVPKGLDEHLRADLRGDTAAVLNGRDEYPLSARASILNRFLASRLMRPGMGVRYESGDLSVERVKDAYAVTFLDANKKKKHAEEFDDIVVRHGPEPAIQRAFTPIWNWNKVGARMRELAELDQTRRPLFKPEDFASSPSGTGTIAPTAPAPMSTSAAAPTREDSFGREELTRRLMPAVLAEESLPTGSGTEERGPVWTIPYPRNPNFTGRASLLQEIRSHFLSAPRPRPLALHGLGGVGKTQLVVEYASRHALEERSYSHVLWLRADEPPALAASYARLTEELGLPERAATEQRQKVEAVRRWLQRHSGWLLIFDNAEQPAALLPYLPSTFTGHVLITSRNPAWGQLAQPYSVNVLTPADSVDFLRKRTGQEDEQGVALLATALGGLPLALTQAAAYIEQMGKPLTDYLLLFERRQKELLDSPEAPIDYPHTVATTWSLSFEQLQAQAPAGAALLSLCSFLAAGPVPLQLLEAGASLLPDELSSTLSDEVRLDKAIGMLRRYSLVQVHHRHLLFHPLVLAVMRQRLPGEGRDWAKAALRLMQGFFKFDSYDLKTWPPCDFLLPHAVTAASQAWDLGIGQELLPGLLSHIGRFWQEKAEYDLARSMFFWGLKVVQTSPTLTPRDESLFQHLLGEVALHAGTLDEAQEHLERARELAGSSFEEEEPLETAILLNDFACLSMVRGRLQEARAHVERALALVEARMEGNHRLLGVLSATLSTILLREARFEESLTHAEQALAISEARFGHVHPKVAVDLFNLANVEEELGRYMKAREHFERALGINEAILGPEHPMVAYVLRDLGGLHQRFGNLEKARACCEHALLIDEACFGPDHGNVAVDLNNLARVLHDQGALEQAREAFERAISIQEPQDHTELAVSLDNLGRVLEELGDLEQARVHFKRSLELRERYRGPEHPGVANVLNNLGASFLRTREYAQAREYLERALSIDEKVYGPHHPEVATDLSNLATALFFQGERERAVELVRRAVSIHEKSEAAPLDETLSCVSILGKFHYERQEWAPARDFLGRALRLQEQADPDESQLFEILVLLGSALRHKGEHSEAIIHLERARALPEKARDEQHLGSLLVNLGASHRELGNGEQARTILKEAERLAEKSGNKANLGPVYLEQGRLARGNRELGVARKVLELAWRLGDEVELERPDLILNEWGLVLEDQLELANARPLFERALKLSEEIRGPDSYTVALIAASLGRVLGHLGDLPAARQHLERALSLLTRIHGADSFSVAQVLLQLAELNVLSRQFEQAKADALRAMAIFSSREPPPALEIAQVLGILSGIHLQAGSLEEARAELERASKLFEQEFGPRDSRLAPVLKVLGDIYARQHQYPLAATTLERAVKLITDDSSDSLQEQLAIARQLGLLHKQNGHLEGARTYMARVVELLDAIPDPEPAELALDLINLANVLRLFGEVEPVLQHVERALVLHARFDRIARELPEEALPHAFALRGELFLEQERWKDARASLEQALRQPGWDSLPPKRLGDLHNNLGIALTELGNFKLALLHAEKALALSAKVHETTHPDYALSLANLATILARSGKPRDALKKYKRALSILDPGHPLAREIQRRIEGLFSP